MRPTNLPACSPSSPGAPGISLRTALTISALAVLACGLAAPAARAGTAHSESTGARAGRPTFVADPGTGTGMSNHPRYADDAGAGARLHRPAEFSSGGSSMSR
jgi:hypothetical protein